MISQLGFSLRSLPPDVRADGERLGELDAV